MTPICIQYCFCQVHIILQKRKWFNTNYIFKLGPEISFRHVHLELHVSTSSLLFFRWLPCFILCLPSGCTFSLLSTLCHKVKQRGSSENAGFNYSSKGLFPFLFDLYSLPCSSLNNISLPAGNGMLVDVASRVRCGFSRHCRTP
jgi:hypothetical protein